MSASSIDVPYHVTPSVLPLSPAQPTSLRPSKRCWPGHSRTSDGQRFVVPPELIRHEDPDTPFQSP